MDEQITGELQTTKEMVEQDFLHRPGVTGVGIGPKVKAGKLTDTVAIRIYVERKHDDIPDEERIPPEIDGHPTDVIEASFEFQVDTAKYDPIVGGGSISDCPGAIGGTAGAVVVDNTSGDLLLLSNWHVLDAGAAVVGTTTYSQPGRGDGGTCPADRVGNFVRSANTITVDGAVCSSPERLAEPAVVEIGDLRGTDRAQLLQRIRKRGRTTGLTTGIVTDVNLTVQLIDGSVHTETIFVQPAPDTSVPFSLPGDSGSVYVNDQNRVVGLHFGGGTAPPHYGLGNHIIAVEAALNIRLFLREVPTGLRTAALTSNGELWAKDGFITTGPWIRVAGQVSSFQLERLRIGVIENGDLFVKKGRLDAAWVKETSGVKAFKLHADRVAALWQDGQLWVKEGPLDAPWWPNSAGNVSSFDLSGSRIAAVENGELFVKEGALTAPWTHETSGVRSVLLEGDRIAALWNDGQLWVKEGPLDAPWWPHSAGNVRSFALEGDRIGVLKEDGELYVKEGALTAPWTHETSGVRSVLLEGDRIAALWNDGQLWVKEGPLDAPWWPHSAGNVTSFSLADDRIGVVQNGGLAVKGGALDAPWFSIRDNVVDVQLAFSKGWLEDI